FHSPVCEFGLHPMVLIFARDPLEKDPAFGEFLKKLDQSIVKHPGLESGACAVFLMDGGFRAAVETSGEEFGRKFPKASVEKEDLEKKLRDLQKSKELERVSLGLALEDRLAAFKLNESAAATVLLCVEQNILARYDLSREKVAEQGEKIANEFEALLQRLDKP